MGLIPAYHCSFSLDCIVRFRVFISFNLSTISRPKKAHVPLLFDKEKIDHVEKMFFPEVNHTSFHRIRSKSDVGPQARSYILFILQRVLQIMQLLTHFNHFLIVEPVKSFCM